MNTIHLKQFYDEEYVLYSGYDSFRSLASYVDGFKNSARKIVYVVDKLNVEKPEKVSRLASRVADLSQFMHGETSLVGVMVGLAQNFPGTNNINLLRPEGSFGNRSIQIAAAGRYIFTKKEKIFDKIIKKDDFPILTEQFFEGECIEPRFFVPIIPFILVNGSEGIGNGFAQKILPRNPQQLIKIIKDQINGKKVKKIEPWFRGFNGSVIWNEIAENWEIRGKFERVSQTTLKITELPVHFDLNKYRQVLDELEDTKQIFSYIDKCDGKNKFEFEVRCSRDFLAKTDEEILNKLKLIKRVSENFTCIDEKNSIREFQSETEIIEAFVKIRLDYYDKRKVYLLNKLNKKYEFLTNRYRFIAGVIKGRIIVSNRTKDLIVKDCIADKIKEFDGSYDYCLNMPIYSLTKEKLETLKEEIKKVDDDRIALFNTSIESIWQKDLEDLEKTIKEK